MYEARYYGKILAYAVLLGSYKQVARLPSSYMPFAYRYPTYCSTQTGQHSHLLDISRQLACTKLGSRGKYQPVQYCWVHTSRLLGYLVHTCRLPIDIQQIYCSTQTGQHSRLQRSCCPVWVLQLTLAALMLSSLGTATYTCIIHV